MATMTGAQFLAETLQEYGVTHTFYMPMVVTRALVEFEKLGIQRIMTHGEKAAAYMADGYARASRRPAVCMAQNVGAANLAAGLQDAYLARSPVIAITGRRGSMQQQRNSYQEIDHVQPFSAVTKYNINVDSAAQLPYSLRQAFREATSGAPGPVHLGFQGTSGNVVVDGEADLDVVVEQPFTGDTRLSHRAARRIGAGSGPGAVRGPAAHHRRRRAASLTSQAQRELVETGGDDVHPRRHIPQRQGQHPRQSSPCRWGSAAPTPDGAPIAPWPRPTWCCSSAAIPEAR